MPKPLAAIRLMLGVLPLLAVAVAAHADDPLEGELEIRSAYAVPSHGVIMLSARVAYPRSELLSQTLKDGVTLSFDLECVVSRHRRFWLDEEAVSLVRHSELSYQVVADRYLLRNVDAGTQETFATLEAALDRVGTVEEWPIAVEAMLPRDEDWQIALRAGMRRGHMPDALRALVFWSDAWHRTSEWYTWTLVR